MLSHIELRENPNGSYLAQYNAQKSTLPRRTIAPLRSNVKVLSFEVNVFVFEFKFIDKSPHVYYYIHFYFII